MSTTKTVAALPGKQLSKETIGNTLEACLVGKFSNQSILVLVPDHTRSLPLPDLFRNMVALLNDAKRLDFMVALGTHPPLDDSAINRLLGILPQERNTCLSTIAFLNHNWADPEQLVTIGKIDREQVQEIAGSLWHPTLGGDVPVRINKAILEYDHIIILGPTFPHEVVGFSGGAKYLFPGISGPEMIHTTHWLGALAGVANTIGFRETPMRTMIHTAADLLPKPVTLIALVVEKNALAGICVGDLKAAWQQAAALSEQRHIRWCQHTYRQVLSCPSPMYDELWTASKAMYKLEPVVQKHGEIIIYAPHLRVISRVHGQYILESGYHILTYFLENWATYQHIPLGVLAHLTHLRGAGVVENGIEMPDIKVTLSSKIAKEDCHQLNLGYRDPDKIDPAQYMNREDQGILYVPKAGEILYRPQPSSNQRQAV